MPGPSLHVTDKTSIQDLQRFAAEAGDGAKIRGKRNSDKSITLYASEKKTGGLKNRMFGTTAKRRAAAQSAITQIFYANTNRTQFGSRGGKLDDDLTDVITFMPSTTKELTGKSLKELASMAGDALNEAKLAQNLPAGMNADAKGMVTGRQVTTTVPTDSTGLLRTFAGKDLATTLQGIKRGILTPTSKYTMIDGQKVCNQATKDFWRLDFNVPLPNGSRFKSSDDRSKDQNIRNKNATAAIRQYAGSDAATTVLSSVLTQGTISHLPGCLAKPDGKETKFEYHSAFSRVGRDFTMRNADGSKTPVEPRFVGGAKWNLSKVGNDFKVSVSWLAHAAPKEGFENELPLHKDGVIGVQFDVDFIVDGAAASRGELVMTMPGGVRSEFTGRLLI